MMALQEDTSIGQYRIERLLPEGQGGFARVAAARRMVGQELHERVAIKIAHTRPQNSHSGDAHELVQAYADTLIGEAETLRQLRHPGIARIYPITIGGSRISYVARAPEIDGDPWYFVMEYLGGGSLDALVAASEHLEPPLAVEIAQQVCMALDHIHKAGFAHLDIKTNNVLFRQPLNDRGAPEAVLIDFGSAQKFLRQADVEQMTLVYAPPERVRIKKGAPPESFVDKPAADVYSLGILLYRMVAGRLPFTGSRSHVMTDILNTTPTQPQVYAPALSRLPELNGLIMAMLEKQPANRPKAPDVLERLEKAIPSPRVWGGLPELPSPEKRDARPWRGAFVGLALVAIVAAPAGYAVGHNGGLPGIPRPRPAPEATNVTPPITATSTLNPQAGAALRPTTPPLKTVTPPPATALGGASATPSATTGHDTVTPAPAPTLTPVPTFTTAPIATSSPVSAPTPVVKSAPIQAALSPALQDPANNENRSGEVEFRWLPAGALPAGAGYEVVWWPEGADPNAARGFAPPTTGTSLNVNLDGFFDNSRAILWTVLVVDARLNSYKRLTQPSANNARRLVYQVYQPAQRQEQGDGKP